MKYLYASLIICNLILSSFCFANETYIVRDIDIKASGESATSAKDEALNNAVSEAYKAVMERITPPEQLNLIPKLNATELMNYVASFEIKSENVTPTYYFATIDISFQEGMITDLASKHGISAHAKTNYSKLIIPVMNRPDSKLIIEENNLWKNAWKIAAQNNPNILIPVGDLFDLTNMEFLKTADFNYIDPQNISSLKKHYKATDVIITDLYIEPEIDNFNQTINSVRVNIISFPSHNFGEQFFTNENNQPNEEFLKQVAKEIIDLLNQTQKTEKVAAPLNNYIFSTPINTIAQLNYLKNTVFKLNYFKNAKIIELTINNVKFTIDSEYDLETLQQYLANSGYNLTNYNNEYILNLN